MTIMDVDQLKRNSFEVGPCYTPLLSNGLPVLGAWEVAPVLPTNIDLLSTSPEQRKSYIPLPGPVILRSIKVDEKGRIKPEFGYRDDLPALIVEEDVNVVSILSFLDDDFIFPSFSLRQTEYQNVYSKKFSPEWVYSTDYGRTMYACHQFMQAMVFFPDEYMLANREGFFNPQLYEITKKLLDTIKYFKGRLDLNPDDYSVEIIPVSFRCAQEGVVDNLNPAKGNWKLTVNDMIISFSVIDNNTGQKVEPISSYLDMNREAFPNLIPNLERMRQLLSLTYSMNRLNRDGYILPMDAKADLGTFQSNYPQCVADFETCCYKLPVSVMG